MSQEPCSASAAVPVSVVTFATVTVPAVEPSSVFVADAARLVSVTEIVTSAFSSPAESAVDAYAVFASEAAPVIPFVKHQLHQLCCHQACSAQMPQRSCHQCHSLHSPSSTFEPDDTTPCSHQQQYPSVSVTVAASTAPVVAESI